MASIVDAWLTAQAGHTVTATLAYGIDSTAQRATAEAGRASLAVLPRGLDSAHPHAHAPLLRPVLDSGGAAVSLYRPGTAASGAALKASAVLLAVLARAVIHVETLDHVEAMSGDLARCQDRVRSLEAQLVEPQDDLTATRSSLRRMIKEGSQ
ncbi:DNA-processing protein DprA [Streptomyces sp. NPDC047461]|uniref:DNA-processing protein DprA n=1 Tax=Streptomyces sp. NPDC047461 TaxID=3155619 RepID=UPI0033C0373C